MILVAGLELKKKSNSGLQFKKIQTAISNHLEFFQKLGEVAIVLRFRGKTASPAVIIVCLVYGVIWCGGSVKCGGF